MPFDTLQYNVLLQRWFYTHSTFILGYACYTTCTVHITPRTFYTSHRMQTIMSYIVYVPYIIQSVPYCANNVTHSKLVYAYFACIHKPHYSHWVSRIIPRILYSTCFMVRCTFQTLDKTMLLHMQYVRKHTLYIRCCTYYYTYHTILFHMLFFTCFSIRTKKYKLLQIHCAVHACLYLPYVFHHRYYTSLY